MRSFYHHRQSAGNPEAAREKYREVIRHLRKFQEEGKLYAYVGELNSDESWAMNSPATHAGHYPDEFIEGTYPYCQFVLYYSNKEDEKTWNKWAKESELTITPHRPLDTDTTYTWKLKRHYEFLDAVKKRDSVAVGLFLDENRGISFEDFEGNSYMQYATFEQIARIGDYARTHPGNGIRETYPRICKRCGTPFKPGQNLLNSNWCPECIAESMKGVYDIARDYGIK